jgi:hypothetical protein
MKYFAIAKLLRLLRERVKLMVEPESEHTHADTNTRRTHPTEQSGEQHSTRVHTYFAMRARNQQNSSDSRYIFAYFYQF